MYLLTAAIFVASIYSYFTGDISNARLLLVAAVVLGGARLFIGPQEEASLVRKIALGIGVLILVVAAIYTTRAVFG